jgi:hypothetical protein
MSQLRYDGRSMEEMQDAEEKEEDLGLGSVYDFNDKNRILWVTYLVLSEV